MNNKVSVVLKGQEYMGKIDFTTLANIQKNLNKQGVKIAFQEIFSKVAEQDFLVINEIVIQSILRCHPQIKRHIIEDKMDLGEMEVIFSFLTALVESAMPKAEEGK